MFKSFFEARDTFNGFLLRGDVPTPEGDRAMITVFRVLLECTMFSGQSYGYVQQGITGQEVLARLTGYTERSIRAALRDMEKAGLIERHSRGKAGTDIRISWSPMWSAP
jgi:hypothetical protein